jgi:hypothetical protein
MTHRNVQYTKAVRMQSKVAALPAGRQVQSSSDTYDRRGIRNIQPGYFYEGPLAKIPKP